MVDFQGPSWFPAVAFSWLAVLEGCCLEGAYDTRGRSAGGMADRDNYTKFLFPGHLEVLEGRGSELLVLLWGLLVVLVENWRKSAVHKRMSAQANF